MTRAQVKAILRTYLGTTIDDPLYGDTTPTSGVSTVLDPLVQQAVTSLAGEIQQAVPEYFILTATLVADGTRVYSLNSLTRFAGVVDLRYSVTTPLAGSVLHECPLERLEQMGTGYYTLVGFDEACGIVVPQSESATQDLLLRYRSWPADLADDTSAIVGVPAQFHDVVALEALFAFALGGESARPRELELRWRDRRAQLFEHLTHRTGEPRRTRLAAHPYF